MRGLVIGRFQPLHQGHEAIIRRAIEDCVNVTVGIGSSRAKRSVKNPFSLEEREAMLRAGFGDRIDVVAVPDIHDPPNYAAHVMEITGPVDRVFGNDEETVSLFEDAGLDVRRPGLVQRDRYQASQIRLQMAEGDGAWRKAVSPAVLELLDGLDAGKRIRLLEASS